MNHELKMKILGQLLSHLESLDAGELRGKPKEASVEVTKVGLDPKAALDEHEGDDAGDAEKGPMEKLMEEKGETPEQEALEQKDEPKGDGDELSDDELEELIKEHLK